MDRRPPACPLLCTGNQGPPAGSSGRVDEGASASVRALAVTWLGMSPRPWCFGVAAAAGFLAPCVPLAATSSDHIPGARLARSAVEACSSRP